jgi:hypothetical protein
MLPRSSVEAAMPLAPLLFALALALLAGSAFPAFAQTEVDLALVLAVDISYSMDDEEQLLQREGFIEAFQSPIVHEAIARGAVGRIGITYMEWAGSADQKVIVPWRVIDGAETALAFAAELASHPTRRARFTSISGALDFSTGLLAESGLFAARQVIDVSGDGANNNGRNVSEARADVLAKGITINGLPIMLKEPRGYWDIKDLDLYYRDCVIGGVGAFMVPAREKAQFREAIKTKIVREVAGLTEPAPLIQFAQAGGGADCRAGENARERWRD